MSKRFSQQTSTCPRFLSYFISGLILLSSLIPLEAMAVLALDPTRIVLENESKPHNGTPSVIYRSKPKAGNNRLAVASISLP